MFVCFILLIKIADRVNYLGLSQDDIWDHFEKVVVPAIQRWQMRDTKGTSNLGKLLDLALKKVYTNNEALSEVAN